MTLKNKMIMEEYHKARPDFVALGDVVTEKLREIAKSSLHEVLAIESRVKASDSLAGKLELKGEKYGSLADITDILGTRIVCFFSDDVDAIAPHIEEAFEIDWENSVDKRQLIRPDAFGYLSLHYICSLRPDGNFPEALCGKKFEVQIRSSLQHTWSVINHDMGYKSEFGVPRAMIRELSRVASLLEIADERFVTIRNFMSRYSIEVREKLANDQADDIAIDLLSLREYMLHSKKMREFLIELASVCGAKISEISPEPYLNQLDHLGKKTIGDLQNMLKENRALALELARRSLDGNEIDLLSTNVGLRFLCRAELLDKGYSQEHITEFFSMFMENHKHAERQAKFLLATAAAIKEEWA